MFLIIGYVVVLLASLGTYAMHGDLLALWVPLEYVAIFGLMIGGFVAGNSGRAMKATLKALPQAMKGSMYNRALYMDERTLERKPHLTVLAEQMRDLIAGMGDINLNLLAAE